MKVKLSIRKYIGWIWFIERNRDIRKEYKKLSDLPLSDLPDGFLPKLVFVDEKEFNDALKVCGSDIPEEGLNIVHGKDIDIEWVDDFNYQEKIDAYR